MKFKSTLATFVSALVLTSTAFAIQSSPKVCPSVSAIQAEGMTMAAEMVEGLYLTYNLSHYDTPLNWAFIIGPVNATSDESALEEGNQQLTTLSGTPSPEESGGAWACEYNTASDELVAVAILADETLSPMKMGQYLRRAR